MMFGGKFNSGKCKQILSDLRSGDTNKITEAVTSLANELSLAEEGFFGTTNLDLLIPELINCLKMENTPEIMSKNFGYNRFFFSFIFKLKIITTCFCFLKFNLFISFH